ncbi:tetratricopeptide repeat protein [Streptomyces sp. A0642]|uniref:tetratricopeptide repeat protein n=1 Tax=Streptomyces sp. A0642 TaxID=2563100 RepID=UPI0010A229E5|nr:tetratricopeptide repeat protein [Streptomyces sp. A0642]THA79322.1 tetratricopeptide repeat protein [Streptomyces sp. A0642]
MPGPDAGVACAAQLIGQDLPSAEDTLEELVEAGLLGPQGDWFSDRWNFWGHWTEVFDMAARSAGLLGDEALRATHLCDAPGSLPLRSAHLLHLGEALLAQGRDEEAHEAFRACVALGPDADQVRLCEARARLARLDAVP